MTCVPPGPDGAGRLHVVWRFRPCCLMHPWAAARPRAVRAASCCLLPRQISGRRAACPPARRPRRERRSARRLEARPGPAGLAAASNRSGVSVCCLARPCRPWAPQTGTSGALRTGGACCADGLASHAPRCHAVQSSPCSACCWRQRYKVRSARAKPANKGHFGRAGRVLYRKCCESGVLGEFCLAMALASCWVSVACALCGQTLQASGRPSYWWPWGLCTT